MACLSVDGHDDWLHHGLVGLWPLEQHVYVHSEASHTID